MEAMSRHNALIQINKGMVTVHLSFCIRNRQIKIVLQQSNKLKSKVVNEILCRQRRVLLVHTPKTVTSIERKLFSPLYAGDNRLR